MANRADQRKFHYIYKITRNDGSGKYYIGMHSTDDLEDGYFGSGQRLWKSIKKYGMEAHSKEILEFLPGRKELRERERDLVNEELLKDHLCLNLALGGGGPPEFQASTSEKMKAAWTPERKEAQAERLREVTRKRFENYWENNPTPKEKLQAKREAEGWVPPDRSIIATAQWARVQDKTPVKQAMSDASKGKVPIINPQGVIKRVHLTEIQQYLDDGWIRGRTLNPSKETLRKRKQT